MDTWERLEQECMQCRGCGLAETRTHVVFGDGAKDAEILLEGEGPGQHEDEQGVPFVGKAGLLLDDMLEEGMTEAEATAKLGSPSQIAQSILQEVPLGKLVSTRMKPKSGWTPLAIVLAVVGSPVWVPLLLLAAALVLSLFVSIWALGVAAVAVVVGLAVAGGAAPILAIRAAVLTLPLGLLLLGGGLVLLGLCVLGGLMAVELCKLLWQLTVWLAHKIKGLFIRKEENL